MSATDDSEQELSDDPRGTLRGLPEGHLAETGLVEDDTFCRADWARDLYPLEVERDEQGRPIAVGADLRSAEISGHVRAHTDVSGMQTEYPLSRYDPTRWRKSGGGWGVVDDLIEHYWLGQPKGQTAGGIFAFANGPPGKGKSTLLRTLAMRFVEANGHRTGERVIWRGSPSRCEWLALGPWARLVLPKHARVNAKLKPKRPTDEVLRDVNLGNFVREVVYYEDPIDALEKSRTGGISVVYPDPTFSGAEKLYRSIPNRTADEPPKRDELFADGDPLPHYWIALLLAAVDGRESSTPVSFVLDEIKEIATEGAMKDAYGSYQKIHDIGGDLSADARKKGVSLIGAGHGEAAISAEWRRKIHYRVHTAGREAPPSASGLKGFGSTPFFHNVNKGKDPGEGVIFDSENFEELDWPNVQTPLPAFDLQVEVRS